MSCLAFSGQSNPRNVSADGNKSLQENGALMRSVQETTKAMLHMLRELCVASQYCPRGKVRFDLSVMFLQPPINQTGIGCSWDA